MVLMSSCHSVGKTEQHRLAMSSEIILSFFVALRVSIDAGVLLEVIIARRISSRGLEAAECKSSYHIACQFIPRLPGGFFRMS